MESQNPESKSILRLKQVLDRTGLSSATIYRRMAAKEFPLPIDLGGNSIGWVEAEVAAWIEGRISASGDRQRRPSRERTLKKLSKARDAASSCPLEQAS